MVQPPPGGRILTPEEAIQTIESGDHVGSMGGSPGLNEVLVIIIRLGFVTIALQADGQLAISMTPEQEILFKDWMDNRDN